MKKEKLLKRKKKLLKKKEKLENVFDGIGDFIGGDGSDPISNPGLGIYIWFFTMLTSIFGLGFFIMLPVAVFIVIESLLLGWIFPIFLCYGVIGLNKLILNKKIDKIERKLEMLKSNVIEKTNDKELQIQPNETIESLEQKQALIKQMIEQKRIQELKKLKQQQKELDYEIHKREQEIQDELNDTII